MVQGRNHATFLPQPDCGSGCNGGHRPGKGLDSPAVDQAGSVTAKQPKSSDRLTQTQAQLALRDQTALIPSQPGYSNPFVAQGNARLSNQRQQDL